MVAYWPTSTEPLAAPMNAIPKIVFSRSGRLASEPTTALRNATEAQLEAGSPLSADGANWDDTQTLSGELGPRITALKAEPGKDLLAHGGASFAQGLVRQGLVDEYRLLLHPVVLGADWHSSTVPRRSISIWSTRRGSAAGSAPSSTTRSGVRLETHSLNQLEARELRRINVPFAARTRRSGSSCPREFRLRAI